MMLVLQGQKATQFNSDVWHDILEHTDVEVVLRRYLGEGAEPGGWKKLRIVLKLELRLQLIDSETVEAIGGIEL